MHLLPVVSSVAHSQLGNLSLFGKTGLAIGEQHDTKDGASGYSIPEVSVKFLPFEALTTPHSRLHICASSSLSCLFVVCVCAAHL